MGRRALTLPPSLSCFFLVAVVVCISGCAKSTVQPVSTVIRDKQWPAGALFSAITERAQQFRSIRALAQVDYLGPDGKSGFQEAVLVQRPDQLRLETLSLLGAVLIVTVNEKEIVGYHPRDGVFIRGQRSEENLLRYTQIPLGLEEITALLMGLPPVNLGAPWRQEGNALVFTPDGRQRDVVTFESQLPVPTRWQRFKDDGAVALDARFGDYISTSAGLFPSSLTIEAHILGKKLNIHYQEPELNPALPADNFSQRKPAHAQEFRMEAIGS